MNSQFELFHIMDWEGNEVHLTVEQWEQHILVGHPELKAFSKEISETVSSPHFVLASETDQDVKLFYRKGFTQGKYDKLFLKVVVNYRVRPATVRTAFFTGTLAGGEILCARYP